MDDNKESFYSLEWSLDHILGSLRSQQQTSPDSPPPTTFKLVLIHVILPAVSVLRLPGPGAADVLPHIENNLKHAAAAAVERSKKLCQEKSITDLEIQVAEGDARSVLCEAVETHNADMLVVGSHGYGAFKTAILGSASDYS